MKKIVLASNNSHKLQELTQLLEGIAIEVLPQSDFNLASIDETGSTFVENAILKARFACEQTGLAALADDSGLIVDVLDGAPGIYSARYAGTSATDEDNNQKLLEQLAEVASPRTARYYCVIVLLQSPCDAKPIICEGVWEGEIAQAPKGQAGFGYDPLFYVRELGSTVADLAPMLKQRYSHRALAMHQLNKKLRKHYGTR